jgi:hypothetical protein
MPIVALKKKTSEEGPLWKRVEVGLLRQRRLYCNCARRFCVSDQVKKWLRNKCENEIINSNGRHYIGNTVVRST